MHAKQCTPRSSPTQRKAPDDFCSQPGLQTPPFGPPGHRYFACVVPLGHQGLSGRADLVSVGYWMYKPTHRVG